MAESSSYEYELSVAETTKQRIRDGLAKGNKILIFLPYETAHIKSEKKYTLVELRPEADPLFISFIDLKGGDIRLRIIDMKRLEVVPVAQGGARA